jgi:DNA-binding CsgD family transcriptional regulator
MLVTVEPDVSVLPPAVSVPAVLRPLVEAANGGHSLQVAIQEIMNRMGFSSFMYGVATGPTLHRDERFFIWTTAPQAWVAEYDQNSYVEIDPRASYAFTTLSPPLIWDKRIANGDPKAELFLSRAATYGIGSGLAVFMLDYQSRVLVCLNQPERRLTEKRRKQIAKCMGDAMQLASIFHLLFMRSVIEKGIPPLQQGSPLSARERQCLQLAARGMVGPEIGHKLEITERTVNFHFSNIISKLGVLNRHEAIAMGVAHGLIQVDPRATPLIPLQASRIRDAQLRRWENLRKRRESREASQPESSRRAP